MKRDFRSIEIGGEDEVQYGDFGSIPVDYCRPEAPSPDSPENKRSKCDKCFRYKGEGGCTGPHPSQEVEEGEPHPFCKKCGSLPTHIRGQEPFVRVSACCHPKELWGVCYGCAAGYENQQGHECVMDREDPPLSPARSSSDEGNDSPPVTPVSTGAAHVLIKMKEDVPPTPAQAVAMFGFAIKANEGDHLNRGGARASSCPPVMTSTV